MQTKETQQELMNFFQHFIERSTDKAEAINSVAKLLDSFCVKGTEGLFVLIYIIIYIVIIFL
jgi:hypothetical protein